MILTLFLVFLGISIFLISLGFASRVTTYALAGFIIMFILGSTVLLPGSLEVKSGEEVLEVFVYGNNFSNYHWDYAGTDPEFNPADLNDPATVFLFHLNTTTIDIYSSAEFNNTWFGLLLSFIGIAGMTISWFEYRSDNYEK